MAISASDLDLHLTANMPENDTVTSGGNIDLARRPVFTQLSSNTTVDVVSDGTDTRDITITGRDATGAWVSETLTLNGTTKVDGSITFERILKVELHTLDGSRTVDVNTNGNTGGDIGSIPPNESGFQAMFLDSASESSQVSRYEKVAWHNGHGSLTLNDAQHQLAADPDAKIKVAVEDNKDDTASVADRRTSPSSLIYSTFVDDGVQQTVPGGTLEAGSFIGIWVEQTLAANDSPLRSSFTLELSGKST